MEKDFFFDAFDRHVMALTLNGSFEIEYASSAFCDALGYHQDDLNGLQWEQIGGLKIEESFENASVLLSSKNTGQSQWIVSAAKTNDQWQLIFEEAHPEKTDKEAREFEIALNESENRKNFLHTILDEQSSIVAVSHHEMLIDVNKAFLKFFHVPSLEYFLDHVSHCIADTFEIKEGSHYLEKENFGTYWMEYVLSRPNETHKVLIRGSVFDIRVVLMGNPEDELYLITLNDITLLEKAQSYIEDSIEYAALIQHSLVPDNEVFRKYVSEYFVIWHPKDVVGGDIYLLEELRNDDEMMFMVIDCTGHGVPGAFVTMLVKAIERQIVGKIINSDEKVSPAKILGIFNRSMKHLLKQESRDSISNAGFDGGILYFNKVDNHILYAGAKTPLYVLRDGKLDIISGDRHSIGYKRSKSDYEFTEYEIKLDSDVVIYLGSDGFIDQQGEEDGMPFGKERFLGLIEEYGEESLADQQEVFLDALMEHRGERVANDDVTMVCLKFLAEKREK